MEAFRFSVREWCRGSSEPWDFSEGMRGGSPCEESPRPKARLGLMKAKAHVWRGSPGGGFKEAHLKSVQGRLSSWAQCLWLSPTSVCWVRMAQVHHQAAGPDQFSRKPLLWFLLWSLDCRLFTLWGFRVIWTSLYAHARLSKDLLYQNKPSETWD